MTDSPASPIRFYSEDELDALYEIDPVEAMRVSRAQEEAKRRAEIPADKLGEALVFDDVAHALERARQLLRQDGGDIELVGVENFEVRVRMKGNCVGCPRSAIDLKNIVEKLLKEKFPQIRKVVNTF